MPTSSRSAIDHGPIARTAQNEREFAASLRLRKWVHDFLDSHEWPISPGTLDVVLIGTFAKGTKTFRAGVLLCDLGYGPQAAMLTRSLFEHTVVAWWLLLCVDDEKWVVESLEAHHQHSGVLFSRAGRLHPDVFGTEPIMRVDEATAASLDRRFGRFGGYWHGKRLDELVREVEARIDQQYADVFWQLYRFVNAYNNQVLHHSSMGLLDSFAWDDPSRPPTIRVGPDQSSREQALWAVTITYGYLVLAMLTRRAAERVDDFHGLLAQVHRDFHSFSAEQLKGVGRNDPCPCGSGRKYKRCHGTDVRPEGQSA